MPEPSSQTVAAEPAAVRRIQLRFADGATREILVPDDSTVLDAARAAGVDLVSQCQVGTCCSCVGRVVSGGLEMPVARTYPLRREELAEGQRLLCQSSATADSEVALDYPVSVIEGRTPVRTTAKVMAVHRLGATAVQLDLRLPKGQDLAFTPGQYARLRVPGTEEWRSYSMASGERSRRKLSFLVRLLPGGAMSTYLTRARPGDGVEIEAPFGGFVLQPRSEPHVLVAGGTGLAPMLSMLETLQLHRPAPPILLVFGCRRGEDLFHLDELAARASFMPTLTVRVTCDEECAEPGVLHSDPVAALRPEDVSAATVGYLCGPPGMVDAARARLTELEVPAARIHSEQFLAS